MDKGAKTLDNEIIRAVSPYFNYVEPSVFAVVTRVHTTSADIKLTVGEDDVIPFSNVPVIRSCYGTETLNLNIGDRVLLVFIAGNIRAPVIVGKV